MCVACAGVVQREVAGRIDDEFCGWPVNVGVGGRYPLAAESSAVLDTPPAAQTTAASSETTHVRPTSLGVVVLHDNATTLMVGTAGGHLLRVSWTVESNQSVDHISEIQRHMSRPNHSRFLATTGHVVHSP